jgi:hypothetical protein
MKRDRLKIISDPGKMVGPVSVNKYRKKTVFAKNVLKTSILQPSLVLYTRHLSGSKIT